MPTLSLLESTTKVVVSKVALPVKVGASLGAFVAILFVIVVLKFASSFNAAANSLSVFNAPGALSTRAVNDGADDDTNLTSVAIY